MRFPPIRFLLAAGIVALAGSTAIAIVPESFSSQPAFAETSTEVAASKSERLASILMAQATETTASTLPGGASSLQESYQDWQVACVSQNSAKRCVMSQQQADPKSGQRVLAMEIVTEKEGITTGTLVLPFGLALEPGVSIKVDEGESPESLRFRTCLPAGCVARLELSEDRLAGMRAGTTLNVTVTPLESDLPVAFAVSLNGFAAALDRMKALVH